MVQGYTDTPTLPDSGYHVHDPNRPQPPVVTPGASASHPPSDAVVLFDGKSLDAFVSAKDGSPCAWDLLPDGTMQVKPKTGDIKTKQSFGRYQLHIEFAAPTEVKGEGQGRGNSGVFLASEYEIQVLDCYQNPTYPDGTVGGIYGQYPPLANAIRKPGEFNVYDILWEPPVFNGSKLVSMPSVTVILNGVVLHHAKPFLGRTTHKVLPPACEPSDAVAPLKLQDHGDLVRFRNIWLRPLGTYDAT
ncbi:MAG: DUF1080 domain-containing protein [Phycisphaerae bacterium]